MVNRMHFSGVDKPHKKLVVWQKAMALALVIYEATKTFPDQEKYGLVSQMRRAAVSIPSNIAEGAARTSNKELMQFISIARGSLSELDTQVEISWGLGYLNESVMQKLVDALQDVDKLLYGFLKSARKKIQ